MDEKLGCERFPAVVFGVDDVVDLADGSGDEQAHEERADEVAVCPEPDVDRVQDTEERETVRDAVNDEPGVSSGPQEPAHFLPLSVNWYRIIQKRRKWISVQIQTA